MRKSPKLFLIVVVASFLAAPSVWAIPRYLQMYRDHPFSLPELRNQCTVCHTNPQGGGPRNEFGKDFIKEGRLLTENLAERHAALFMQDNRALLEDVEIIFNDPENKALLLRKGNSVYRVEVPTRQVKKLEAPDLVAMKLPVAIPQKVIDESRAKMPEPVYSLPFDSHLIDLPTTRPMPKGGVEVRFTHRFSSSTFNQSRRFGGPFDVFGLDSTALVGYGVSYGITPRVSVGVYRARFGYFAPNPIEFHAALNIFQEDEGKFPLSLMARGAIEGDAFFEKRHSANLQFMIGRSATKYANFYLVPTVTFNSNPYSSRERPNEDQHTFALGIGASVRPIKTLPRLALVGEYVPRLAGFNLNDFGQKPMASVGVQFRTYRHAFTFGVTNARGTTTSSYAQGANSFSRHPIDAFSLGFNITRQLR